MALISLSLNEQLAASLQMADIEADIAGRRAKVNTLSAQEREFKSALAGSLGVLAYNAERAKYRLDTAQWNEVDQSVEAAIENVAAALATHREMLATIREELRQVAELEADLQNLRYLEGGLA